MRFDAFISYSHAADGRLAPALQRGLHRLAKPWHRRRALWVFRDHTGLSVSPALWSSIQDALDNSEFLVLLASPEAARSDWVNREIEHWVATRSPDRILPVVTDGEWQWDPARGDFTEDSSAVPAALRGVLAEEPLYLDLRWAREGGPLTLRDPRFRDAVAQLAAPMHGLSKDELEGEDVRQHRRARRLWSAGVGGLTVLALVAALTGVVAVRNAREAKVAAEAGFQEARAAEQEQVAGRSAAEAQAQVRNAAAERERARAAAAEAGRQATRAQQQRVLANQASAEVQRQQANARRQEQIAREQQQVAREAGRRAQEQAAFAKEQAAAAARSTAESERQKRIAADQTRLANDATAVAERQRQIAVEQTRLAEEARAAAEDAGRIAAEQRRLAEDAAAEALRQQRLAEQSAADATKQRAVADEQQRIAIGRRLFNEAQELADRDMATALQLGIAATKLQLGADAPGRLAGMVASTRYAGPMAGRNVRYAGNDVVIGEAGELTVWTVADRAVPKELSRLGRFERWDVSGDGRIVVAATSGEPYATVFDISAPAEPEIVGQIPVHHTVTDVTFGQTGRRLFIATADLRLREGGSLWDLADPRRPAVLAPQIGNAAGKVIELAAFSADGTMLATHAVGGRTGLWDLSSPAAPKLTGMLDDVIGRDAVGALAFLPSTPELVIGAKRQTYVLDLTSRAVPTSAETFLNQGGMVTSIAIAPDGSRMAIAEGDGAVISVIEPYEIGWAKSAAFRDRITTVADAGSAIALSPDSRTLIAGGAQWDTSAPAAPERVATFRDAGEPQGLASAFTASGQLLTVGSLPTAVLRAAPGGARTEIPVFDAPVHRAALTPDGRFVAVADAYGRVRVTDLADPARPVRVAEFAAAEEWSVAAQAELGISPDGSTVAVGDGRTRTVELWDVAPGRPARRLDPPADLRLPVAFGPGGRLVAASRTSDTTAGVWDLRAPSGPAQLGKISGARGARIGHLAMSSDGNTVAVAQGRYSTIWTITSPERPRSVGRFAEDLTHAAAMAFSHDGSTVVAVDSGAETLSAWSLAGGSRPILMGEQDVDRADRWSAAISRDGRSVLIADANESGNAGRATLWNLGAMKDLIADPSVRACALAGVSLTREKWSTYLPELDFAQICPASGESAGDLPSAGSRGGGAGNAVPSCAARHAPDYVEATNRYGAVAWCSTGGYVYVSVRCVSESTFRRYTANGPRIWSLSSSDISAAHCRPGDGIQSVTASVG
ncbi:TIR domain-containing protein [Spirilliplanes yamanashiensis]|uniref:TIR domain-containing protein n=1 Tax=Spirilliplanes yamanashiensis TaxID=42233 RepID=A0A8J3Y6Q4_9ACTN|nr:TIR domain-containing protein [Spirilliplanes yamanashiensis]MDP9814705.1 WD40 repeat protein [Spirilliplanes yamanashiensis]GIJ02357.1 hypothetical protein Sya03_17090 [Spirilliplanes yamanashiensis]